MRHFCTYFDRNFLCQGLALYHSLRAHAGDFRLHILCLDKDTEDILSRLGLPGLHLIGMKEFEAEHAELLAVKNSRSVVEYYWTCTPLLVRHVLRTTPDIEQLSYLDADLFFYSNLDPIYGEWGDGELFLIPHRLDHSPENQSVVGRFNVGMVGFRNTPQVLRCLDRWAEQCIGWCHLQPENDKLGDQKYLDEWPTLYHGVVICQNIGVGAGAWNIRRYTLQQSDGVLLLDNLRLIMLHLNFVEVCSRRYMRGLARWQLRPAYREYAKSIGWAVRSVCQVRPEYRPLPGDLSLRQWLSETLHGGIILL